MNAIPDNFILEEPYFPLRKCKYCKMVMNDCICEEIFDDDKGDE